MILYISVMENVVLRDNIIMLELVVIYPMDARNLIIVYARNVRIAIIYMLLINNLVSEFVVLQHNIITQELAQI